MAYPLIGSNATPGSWGSTNYYSVALASLTAASASYSIDNDGQDITALGAFATSEIPGLLSARATLGGWLGATPALGTSGSIAYSGYTTAPYGINVQSFNIAMRTPAVHDITTGSSGSPATFRAFRPDIFTCAASFTSLVDSATALTLPNVPGDTIGTATFTIVPGITAALTGIIRTLGVRLARPGKQLVTYGMHNVGTVTFAGGTASGPLARTYGSTNNADPLWSAGGSVAGALVLNMLGAGTRKITFTDSFWTSIGISSQNPGSPVAMEYGIQPTGTFSFT